MQTPRRFLPAIGLITAFEASARLLSFTAAAKELALTQSAVSRQIRALEEQVGVDLFVRERQTIRLTPAGKSYARDIRDVLRRLSAASLNLRANPNGGTLNLAILPTFGTRWLAPRLPAFLASNPGISINLATHLVEFDFRREPLDAAIHFGSPNWPGTHSMSLLGETVIPMASADFVSRHRMETAGDLRAVPLLHISSRPDAWERWFRAQEIEATGVTGMLFDQFATIAQAAAAGLGVALLPTILVEREVAQGELVVAIDLPVVSEEGYHLVWPLEQDGYWPLKAFRDWLTGITSTPTPSR
jgi:LysR family transcriptional regulator, glycine cleavage system transcriptional activator